MAQRRNPLVLLIALLLFLVLLVFYFYVARPASQRSADLEQEISRVENMNRILQVKLKEKAAASDTRSVDGIQAELPYWDNSEQLVLDLEQLGREAQVSHVSLSFSGDLEASQPLQVLSDEQLLGIENSGLAASAQQDNPATDKAALPGPLKLQVAAVIKGTYENILAYVQKVYGLERLITVDSLEISRPCSCETNKELNVNFNFTAYFEPGYRKEVESPLLPYAESSVPAR